MQVALRLIVLEFPQTPEDCAEFLLVRHVEVLGWCLGLRVRHTAERIIERMKLIVQIIEGGIDAFPALGLAYRGLHHRREIDHCFNPACAFRLRQIISCSWIEQIAAAAESDQQHRESEQSNRTCHKGLPH